MIAYQRINSRAKASDESNCKDPDRELVVRAQAGDRDAFGRLVLQHKESISRVIFRITKSREDARTKSRKHFSVLIADDVNFVGTQSSRHGSPASQ
jgi:hypothetical protein